MLTSTWNSAMGSNCHRAPALAWVRARVLALVITPVLATASAAAAAGPFVVATYNLRYDAPADAAAGNGWAQRRALVKALIREHGFDLVATQEGLKNQIDDLDAMGEFARVGVGRDDGAERGEFAAIFYRRDRFDLLASGTFWLSQTPDVPSKGWDAGCCKRISTWARLRDREDGRVFAFFSLHFDHQGELARRESAKLVLRRMAEIGADAPVLIAGDFNATPQTEEILTMSASLRDARDASETPPHGPVGTFNGFRGGTEATERIDYVFVSPQVRVLSYAVVDQAFEGRHASDHHPVVARVLIGPRP